MLIAYKTDIGRQREINEDSVLVDGERGIFLLADGLGGHQAGEVASDICVNTIYSYIKEKIDEGAEQDLRVLLSKAVLLAHETIKRKAMTDPRLLGMGTTIVGMMIKNSDAFICHVGDSRAYLVRAGIRQITRDHSYTGNFSNDIDHIRKRSPILSQAVGTGADIKPEINYIKLLKGDIIVICSDGLTDSLKDEEIDAIIHRHETEINEAAAQLVKEANNRGGRDNISVILVQDKD